LPLRAFHKFYNQAYTLYLEKNTNKYFYFFLNIYIYGARKRERSSAD